MPGVGVVADGAIVRVASADVIRVVPSVGMLELVLMARVALARRSREDLVGVALDAIDSAVAAGERELRSIMIERYLIPGGGVVADGAVVLVVESLVIWVGHVERLLLVAGPAVGRSTGVLSRDVTFLAVGRLVRPGERELRLAMIERHPVPRLLRVADGAVVVVAMLDVIRVPCRLEPCLMAGVAIEGCPVIPLTSVAGVAGEPGVSSGQLEPRPGVVECSVIPIIGGVADGAVVVVVPGDVIRVFDAVVVGLVTGPAVGRRSGEPSSDVALVAGSCPVRTGEREGSLVMIECRSVPAAHRMADGAVVVVVVRCVIRVASRIERRVVTVVTFVRRPLEHPADMARGAVNRDMCADQRVGRPLMVKR